VPFFNLMGEFIFHSNLGLDAVNVLDKWLGKLRGQTLRGRYHDGRYNRSPERIDHSIGKNPETGPELKKLLTK
jgi:hypothetical protein